MTNDTQPRSDHAPAVTVEGFERFAMVPEWVYTHPDITPAGIRAWIALWHHADRETRSAKVRRKTLATLMGCSANTVDRALENLVDIGAVTVEEHVTSTGQQANFYTLVWSKTAHPLPTDGEPPLPKSGEAPSPQMGNHSLQEPLVLEPDDQESAPRRKRDPIWDALVELFGEPAPSTQGLYGTVRKYLTAQGATPEQMHERARVLAMEWAQRGESKRFGPGALMKWWSSFDGLVGQAAGTNVRELKREMRDREALARAQELDRKAIEA